jgi:tetratricopeptide (TPR) repeat protein
MRRVVLSLAMAGALFWTGGAAAADKPSTDHPTGGEAVQAAPAPDAQAATGEVPTAAAETAAGEPEPGAPADGSQKKSNRRPYTATEFEMENMSQIEMDGYAKISKIREDSIDKMKTLARDNPNYANIADLYYRIAEFTTENIRYKLAVQGRQYKKDLAAYEKGELKDPPEPPVKDYSPSLPFYERILMEHPQYPRAEEVLFYYGRNGAETGKSMGDDALVEKSVKALNKLEEHFPTSTYLPKAYLISGEYFFNKNNLFEALKYYKKLTENHKDSPMYLYALYKLGWTYYNYQQYDKTLVAFEEVITALREQGQEDATLRDMTLKDYVITVSEAGQGWTGHRDYLLREVPAERAYAMLHQMADMLAQRGFNDDAVGIFEYFISLDANAPSAVDYWDRILSIYRWNYGFEDIEEQVRKLRHFFRADGAWFGNNSDAQVREQAEDLIVKWDLALAEFYLEEGLYFNKGEESFLLAINRCNEILERGAGKRQEQAWAGILLAYQGLIRLDSGGRLIYVSENILGPAYPDDYKLPKKLRRMELVKYEGKYMDAAEKYAALANRTGQKPGLKPLEKMDMQASIFYHAALFNYLRGRNAEGLAWIDRLIAYNPKAKFLGWAGDMTFQLASRAEDWVNLQLRMKAMLDAGNTQVTPEESLKEYLCAGLIEEALALAAKNSYGDAMERLSQAGQTCEHNMDKAGEAYYQLGEVAVKGGFIPQAKDAFQKVLNEYGKSRYRSMALRSFKKIKDK